ncbi:alkane 1-monooxygenase [Fulvivirgaceae bacterium BMA10]|uniref:Alkane 1-monooxygenase n=1 Tax=Splendidivirga corallicola TaxID=3051826 RepID=A0ABT8KRR4_9BACT|nr:alkane 1-monooxygenase [Fulvivirgaceae bacterium BMA10]
MFKFKALKYLSVFTIPVTVIVSFTTTGPLTFLPMLYAFGLIPLLEFIFPPDPSNVDKQEQEIMKKELVYDLILYLMVPIQFAFIAFFLVVIDEPGLSAMDVIGRVSALGILCGVIGINAAHELGHRSKAFEKFLAKSLLLTSLYMHFFIEHNRGHHSRVSTQEDPASARFGENIYFFWIRSIVFSYLSAWKLEAARLKKKGLSVFSAQNEMIRFQLIQTSMLMAIGVSFGWITMLYFIGAALMGILLLETVNYIEHYGLRRKKVGDKRYERTKPQHSWNSNHIVGRIMLFELSRHSDHHYLASKKYQILDHHVESPQMPTGYPGMMLLSLIPPLWFYVMNPRAEKVNLRKEIAIS